jgi:hypothetical protein
MKRINMAYRKQTELKKMNKDILMALDHLANPGKYNWKVLEIKND